MLSILGVLVFEYGHSGLLSQLSGPGIVVAIVGVPLSGVVSIGGMAAALASGRGHSSRGDLMVSGMMLAIAALAFLVFWRLAGSFHPGV